MPEPVASRSWLLKQRINSQTGSWLSPTKAIRTGDDRHIRRRVLLPSHHEFPHSKTRVHLGNSAIVLKAEFASSHDMLRCQCAGFGTVSQFDLDRRIAYPEAVFEFMRDRCQRLVAGMALGHDEMAGQRRLGRA